MKINHFLLLCVLLKSEMFAIVFLEHNRGNENFNGWGKCNKKGINGYDLYCRFSRIILNSNYYFYNFY